MIASSSAITTRIVTNWSLLNATPCGAACVSSLALPLPRLTHSSASGAAARELIEKLVLTLLEFGDLGRDVDPVFPHRVGMLAGLVGLV